MHNKDFNHHDKHIKDQLALSHLWSHNMTMCGIETCFCYIATIKCWEFGWPDNLTQSYYISNMDTQSYELSIMVDLYSKYALHPL